MTSLSDQNLRIRLLEGAVIPAHPLALTVDRVIDERRQRALARYYLEAGSHGLAVGVHTTQFPIHFNGMLRPVLEMAMEEINAYEQTSGKDILKVAGIVGDTEHAVKEAILARELGYETGLLSVAALSEATNDELIEHCRRVSEVIPVIGFYLQTAVGGRPLDYAFWRELFDVEGVVAVKVAPFDRYQSLDVMRALAASGRGNEVALYTGNDDHIVLDLIGNATFSEEEGAPAVGFVGGLLGQWACFTKVAVDMFEQVQKLRKTGEPVPQQLFTLAHQLTDVNGALFDVKNNFQGVIAGIHEALRRQGLLDGIWCLDRAETLGPGQIDEIDRIWRDYPHLRDDEFIRENIDRWLT